MSESIAVDGAVPATELDEQAQMWESAFHLIIEDAAHDSLLEGTAFAQATSSEARQAAIEGAVAGQLLRTTDNYEHENPQRTRTLSIMHMIDELVVHSFPAVRITGLSGRPELNGMVGQAGPRADEITDRYPVTLSNGRRIVNLRIVNLRGAVGPPPAASTTSSVDGWDAEELARMRNPGRGVLAEQDGRCFMALLDMCHYLVDQITQAHRFPDVEAASRLRSERTDLCALLTAQMYSYWYSAPAGPGVYEMLCDWTADQPGIGAATRFSQQLGGRQEAAGRHRGGRQPNHLGQALHVLAKTECSQWPRRRKTSTFTFGGEDATGAALLVDAHHERVYRVIGISTSLGDLMRASGRGDELLGTSLLLTLLPFMGAIVYDGTLRGAPPATSPTTLQELRAVVTAAQAEGTIISQLPPVPDAPLLGKRVVVGGLQAKPELNGKAGIASAFDDDKERYAVSLEDGTGSYKLRAANLEVATPRKHSDGGAGANASDDGASPTLSVRELALQQRIAALQPRDDFWVFRRMGYTESENPAHMGMIMSGKTGMVVGTFQSAQLAPTAGEYLTSLEAALFDGGGGGPGVKPNSIAVDEKGPVGRLEQVLGPAGIQAGYYPPPTEEELTAMGVQ